MTIMQPPRWGVGGGRRSARISSGHRLTIPADAFRQAGFHDGDQVVVKVQGSGRIVVECDSLLDDCAGTLQSMYGDHYQESVSSAPWRH